MRRFWQVRRGGAGAVGSAAGDRGGLWLSLAVFAGAWIFRFLSTTSFHNDQYMHLAWADQVLGGQWPVMDFVDPGMPLTYFLSAAAQVVIGHGAWAEDILCVTLLATGATLTYHLSRRASGSALVGLLAAALQVVIAPRLYSYAKILLHLWAVWLFWQYAERSTRRNLLWIAACTAIAFLVRHDHGAFIGLAALVLFVAVHFSAGVRACARPVLTYAGPIALALLPFLTYVQLAGGVIEYFRVGLSFTQTEQQGRRPDGWPAFDFSPQVLGPPQINVRWAPDVDAATRSQIEARFHLGNPRRHSRRTWRYSIADTSFANVRALLVQPEVEDTAGIDRGRALVVGLDRTPLGRVGRALVVGGWPRLGGLFRRQNAVAWLYRLFVLLPLAAAAVVLARWRGRMSAADRAALMVMAGVTALGATTNYGFLRDPLDVRLADAAAVTLVLAAWLMGQARLLLSPQTAPGPLPVPRRPSPARLLAATSVWILVAGAGTATVLSAADLGDIDRAIEKTRVGEGPRRMGRRAARNIRTFASVPRIDGWIASGDEHLELKQLTRYVRECTAPSDHLLVTWFEPEIYFYAERRFAAGLAFFYPGFFSAPAEQQLALSRFGAQSVPIVLVDAERYRQFFTRDYPQLAAYLDERYGLAAEIEAADGRIYRVLTDRRVTPVRTYQPWSLPCFR